MFNAIRRTVARFFIAVGLRWLAHAIMPVHLPGKYTAELGYHLVPRYPHVLVGHRYWLVRELSFRERQRANPDELLYLPNGMVELDDNASYTKWNFRRST